MRDLIVVCFYWLGDRWQADGLGATYINRLFYGVSRNLKRPFRFVCYTNETGLGLAPEIEVKSFHSPTNRGVLPRLYMFNHEAGLIGNQVLSLDLDVVIVGDLKDLASYGGAFCVRSKFAPGQENKLDGDIIGFWADEWAEQTLWTPFVADPERAVRMTGGRERYWLRQQLGDCHRYDRLWPGQVVSYKRHVKPNAGRVPAGARIVSCHGTPRPHEIKAQWIEENWREEVR
jgi:hypothetical protein